MPKRCLPSVPKCDGSGHVEKILVHLLTRVAEPNPHPKVVLPLVPHPTQPQGHRELVQIQHTHAAEDFWLAHLSPINLALPSRDLIRPSPKESPLKLINLLQSADMDNKRGDMMCGLRREDERDKGSPAHGRDYPALPRNKPPCRLVHQVLEINFLKSMHRQWQPVVPHGKSRPHRREVLKNLIKVNVCASDRGHQALLEVGDQANFWLENFPAIASETGVSCYLNVLF